MYEMKPEYYTGIEQVDNEHKQIFEMADEIWDLYNDELIPDKYDHIITAITKLKTYALTHLQNEEEYMDSINYKNKFMQKVQHDAFRNQVEEWELNREVFEDNQEEFVGTILNFVTDWLTNHILKTDKLLSEN